MFFNPQCFKESQQELPSILEEIEKRIPHSKVFDLSAEQNNNDDIERLTLDDVENAIDLLICTGNRTQLKAQFKIRKKASGRSFLFPIKRIRRYDKNKMIYGTTKFDNCFATIDFGNTDLYIIKTMYDGQIYFFNSNILRLMMNYDSFWKAGKILLVDRRYDKYKIEFDADTFLSMYNSSANFLLCGKVS